MQYFYTLHNYLILSSLSKIHPIYSLFVEYGDSLPLRHFYTDGIDYNSEFIESSSSLSTKSSGNQSQSNVIAGPNSEDLLFQIFGENCGGENLEENYWQALLQIELRSEGDFGDFFVARILLKFALLTRGQP